MTAVAIAVGRPAADKAWPWPEPRLSYANAAAARGAARGGRRAGRRPHWSRTASVCSAGCSTGRPADGHLSVVPAGRAWTG